MSETFFQSVHEFEIVASKLKQIWKITLLISVLETTLPRTVAFKSSLIQLFLLGSLFGVPEGFQAALDFIGFQDQKRI